MAGCSAEHWDLDSAVTTADQSAVPRVPASVAMKVDVLAGASVATMAGR
jgi:hypothetical protein